MSDIKAKMNQIRFTLGLCPDPAGGAYSAPLEPLAVFKRPTFKVTEEEGGRGGERKGKGGYGRGGLPPPQLGSVDPPVTPVSEEVDVTRGTWRTISPRGSPSQLSVFYPMLS